MGDERGIFLRPTRKPEERNLFLDEDPPFLPDPEDLSGDPSDGAGKSGEVQDESGPEARDPVIEAEMISKTESPLILAEANALVIRTGDDQKAAHALRQRIKEAEDKIEEKLRPIANGAYANWKATLRLIDEFKAHFTPVRNIIEEKITRFRVEEERRARAEAEERRKRYEETVRLERERQAVVLRAEAEERAKAAATQREKERIEREAAALAKEVVAAPVALPKFEVKNEGKLEGVSLRKTWSFEIVNEDQIPRKFLTPDLKKLGAEARSMQEKAEVPGVRFFFTEKSAFRG